MPSDQTIIYKVFASWSGSYAGSDSWKLNSGITRAALVNGAWEFEGSSGSVYKCRVDGYGATAAGAVVLDNLIRKVHTDTGVHIEILSENTNWTHLDYDPLQQWVRKGIEK
jgi:hypothetical protein